MWGAVHIFVLLLPAAWKRLSWLELQQSSWTRNWCWGRNFVAGKAEWKDKKACLAYRVINTDVQNRLLDSMGEGEGGVIWENSIETCILSSVKQIASPGWMHETTVQGWCTGMTQRDGGGRGGSGWGNTCKSMADSCQCMAKTTTILWSN